jgi:hypothetical protein
MPSRDYRIREHNACQARLAPRYWEALDHRADLFPLCSDACAFEFRLEDISRYDRVKVECACGREVLLSLDAFAGLSSNARIIERRLRCDRCGEKAA